MHQAREAPRNIMRLAGLAQHRRSRLNSNVRPRETRGAVLQRNRHLSARTERPRSGGLGRDCAPHYYPRGEIGRHKGRRLVVGTTLTQVPKAMTGSGRATSEHRAAWEAIVLSRFVVSHLALARLRTVKGRAGSNGRRATVAGAEQQGAWRNTRNYEALAAPGCGTPSEA